MSRPDRFRTPIKRARGLGSAKDGTHHWIVQRITSVALVFLAIYVVGLVVVFAPSGLVVREAALVAALAPAMGEGPALVLAIASRVWLLIVELVTALAVVTLHGIMHGRARANGAARP